MRHTPDDDPRAAALLLAAVALVLIGLHFFHAFIGVPDMANPNLGSPWAPYSDALGPWLDGGLAYLFHLPPSSYLYRPTIGLFWGALLGATGRVEMIPVFFMLWLAVCVAVLAIAADRALRGALVLTLAFVAMHFPETWQWIGFNVDLAALALTVSGVVLVLWHRGAGSHAALLAGCACLGAAAATRGPMMLAGPLIIAIRVFAMERPPARIAVAAALLFLAPIAIDAGLQRHLHTFNNGLWALYCVYQDPTHGWTPACKAVYLAANPSGSEILKGYLAFRLSGEGWRALFANLEWRTAHDLVQIHTPATFVLILGMAALSSAYAPGRTRPATPFVRALMVVALLSLVEWGGGRHPWAALAAIGLMAAAAAIARQWRALACFAGYLAGTTFLALLGISLYDRLQHTFGFLAILAIGLLVLEARRRESPPDLVAARPPVRTRRALSAAVAAGLVFLYVGSFAGKSAMRDTYLRDVFGRTGSAIKIADDARIDRSLYYTWERKLVYTRHDALAIGSVRKYRSLASPAFANASFVAPSAFLD